MRTCGVFNKSAEPGSSSVRISIEGVNPLFCFASDGSSDKNVCTLILLEGERILLTKSSVSLDGDGQLNVVFSVIVTLSLT